MHSTKFNSIVRSFIIVPLVATTLSVNTFTASINNAIATPAADAPTTQVQQSPEALALQLEREEQAAKIDAYYAKYNMPLAGYGAKMVAAAAEHGVDWRLIPAIAVRESTGGKFACKNNPFGFGSCKIGYKSYDDAITAVATNLGGDNPRTASYYEGKSVKAILQTYNPPSVVPKYADQVMSIMNRIDQMDVS